jgi:hypothetical protein
LRRGDRFGAPQRNDSKLIGKGSPQPVNIVESFIASLQIDKIAEDRSTKIDADPMKGEDKMFLEPEKHSEQALVDAILDALIYDKKDRECLRKDPLVRFLIPNPPGNYDFTIVTAMGVITEGKAGTELQGTFERLENARGVKTIRADTATVRSLEYNAGKIIEAIESARELHVPYGLLGYSQGCANALMAETTLYSGKYPPPGNSPLSSDA